MRPRQNRAGRPSGAARCQRGFDGSEHRRRRGPGAASLPASPRATVAVFSRASHQVCRGVDSARRGPHHQSVMPPGDNRPLRPGDIVELRPAAEILATLDESGALDNMPFMPEMLQYAGRRFTVSRRVEKICDTIAATGSRRVHDTVYLEDLRCDGSGHGGCQAGCRIYWKEAWLRRVDGAAAANHTESDAVRRARATCAGEHADYA